MPCCYTHRSIRFYNLNSIIISPRKSILDKMRERNVYTSCILAKQHNWMNGMSERDIVIQKVRYDKQVSHELSDVILSSPMLGGIGYGLWLICIREYIKQGNEIFESTVMNAKHCKVFCYNCETIHALIHTYSRKKQHAEESAGVSQQHKKSERRKAKINPNNSM